MSKDRLVKIQWAIIGFVAGALLMYLAGTVRP